MGNCNCTTEIIRDGSGQLQRYLMALDPAYAPVDSRTIEDLLVFAKKYAAQIRFYDIPESIMVDTLPPGKISWREFFRRNMAVIAASIAVTTSDNFKKEYDQVTQTLSLQTTPEVYSALYAPIIGMMNKIDRWFTVAIPDYPLYNDLKLAIDSDLKAQAQKIKAYQEGFKFVDPSVHLDIDLDSIENKDVWGLNVTIPPEPGIYTGTTQSEKILSASLFTEDIFHAFYNFLNKLIAESEKYLVFALEEYPSHQPHMALFITFLQLFSKAQAQMNGLTGRMLDFYYKDVLQLETKPSIPDKVHIVFELAKDVLEHQLVTGTSLKGGPDLSGIEQIYSTKDDLVINQAKVKELKTIFVEKKIKDTLTPSQSIHTIYARPIANSADGFGEKFPGTDLKWPTFGIGGPSEDGSKNICDKFEKQTQELTRKDQGRIGFAIASPQLVMYGGKRLLRVKLNKAGASLFARQIKMTKSSAGNVFDIWFTGDKEWFKIDQVMPDADRAIFKKYLPFGVFNPADTTIESSYYLNEVEDPVTKVKSYFLNVYLSPSTPPVVEFNAKLHAGYLYQTKYPVMQVLLNPVLDMKSGEYNKLSANDLSLSVKVGSIFQDNEMNETVTERLKRMGVSKEEEIDFFTFPSDGLTKLVLQNESSGVLPAGKPFDPFSAYPNIGKSFYIGSGEVFNKPLGRLAITLTKTIDVRGRKTALGIGAGRTAEYDVSILERRRWVNLSTVGGKDFSQETLRSNILQRPVRGPNEQLGSTPHAHPRKPVLPVKEWFPETEKGFVRITNLIPVNVNDNDNDNENNGFLQASQNLANKLEIKEVSFSYESELTRMEAGIDEFYHVYPFGSIETYLGASTTNDETNAGDSAIRNSVTKIRAFLGNNQFASVDKEKKSLLVNANNLLLPQFTYLWPYTQYENVKTTANTPITTSTTSKVRKALYNTNRDQLTKELILKARGWTEKLQGGANQYSAATQEEGMLLIGIELTQPLQMVSMLFQFAEGSAADEDNDPPEIHWSYLTNNEWRPLKEESIVSDDTFGFQTTGIVKIEIPEDATNNNTIVASNLYWICASVTEHSDRIPMLIDVVTQAVLAEFQDAGNDPSHFLTALTSGSISKLAVAAAEVGKVIQPFASFDGKAAEVGKEFYTRVSERLRHKARAITPWDYEHLVLDRFPSIYKVKCISHTDPNCLCREPDKIKPVKPTPPAIENCGIETVDLLYRPGMSEADAEENKKAVKAIEKMLKGEKCKVLLTGFSTADNTDSAELTKKRFAILTEMFVKAGIVENRITNNILLTGEKDFVTISEVSSVVAEPVIVGKPKKEEICCGPQIAPGHVLVVPISNLKNRNAVTPLQPKTSRRIMLEIEAYLSKRTSPFVNVHVKNPVYEEVLVFFRVKFFAGFDRGFHMKKLNDEIVHFLTPWAFSDVEEVKFGEKIYASSIINFIEERIYVDFITDFLMVVCRNQCCIDEVLTRHDPVDVEEVLKEISNCRDMEILLQEKDNFPGDIVARPSTSRSLLVSAPKHIIIPFHEPETLTRCEERKLYQGVRNVDMDTNKIEKDIKSIEKALTIEPVISTGSRMGKKATDPEKSAEPKEKVSPEAVHKTVKIHAVKKESAKAIKKKAKVPKKK